jgi:hypothetical protein
MTTEKDENKAVIPTVDGFDGFEDRVEGSDQEARIIQGTRWVFTQDSKWLDEAELEILPDREVVVVDVARVLQKWIDDERVDKKVLGPGEKVPDLDQLNESCPRSEWSKDLNGNPRGPWQFQYIAYAVDLSTMEKISFPTGTVGGKICVSDLVDAVRMMRKFRGPGVFPVVTPSTRWMNTRFGGRYRPHFVIKRWITFGPDGIAGPTPTPSLEGPAAADATNKTKTGAATAAGVVTEPTLGEEMNDSIAY